MERVQEFYVARKSWCSERFGALLPLMVEAVEVEWRQQARLMNTEERLLFRQAHQALGTLNEMWDGAR